ncbi:MAG: Mov34/MPN/PAD-1 family protein [Candidatus Bathyarchaeia archaeon]
MYQSAPPPVSVVWLGEIPFITIIAASVETYRKECCGLLLGYRSWSHWDKTRRALVEQAYQFQTSERSRYSVTVPREESRCKDMIYKLSMFEPLGYFHSHPECDPTPTKDDVQSMKINDIELIVTIEKKDRNVPWRYDASKKLLAGVLGEFRFELAAYTRTKSKSPTVKKLDLLCPFALE